MNDLVDDSTLILKRRVYNIKVKFGNAPLVRARELALDTFKESDAEWAAYSKE